EDGSSHPTGAPAVWWCGGLSGDAASPISSASRPAWPYLSGASWRPSLPWGASPPSSSCVREPSAAVLPPARPSSAPGSASLEATAGTSAPSCRNQSSCPPRSRLARASDLLCWLSVGVAYSLPWECCHASEQAQPTCASA